MAKKYDDFDEPDRGGMFDQVFTIIANHKRGFAVVCVAAAVILLGVIVFGGYEDDAELAANESVPVVRADAEGYKSAPDNPGGMDIPYRDSTVFASNGDAGTENILADENTEQPLPREQLFAGLNTNADQAGAPTAGAAPAATSDMNKVAPVLPGATPPPNDQLVKEAIGTGDTATAETQSSAAAQSPIASIQPTVIDPGPAQSGQAKPASGAVQTNAAKTEAPVATETSPAKTADKSNGAAKVEPASGATAAKGVQPGGSYVQLASVKSTAGAATEYKKLQAKYSGLSGVSYRTQEANLGAKGTFHRIQAGPMSKDDATRICGSIKSAGGSCLVATK